MESLPTKSPIGTLCDALCSLSYLSCRDELTKEQQNAARVLGYTPETWDEDDTAGAMCCTIL